MKPPPLISRAVLEALAMLYKSSRAGRTGEGVKRLYFDYERLLKAANCTDGDVRERAEQQLKQARDNRWIDLIPHKRDPGLFERVEFLPGGEGLLFTALAARSPAEQREEWNAIFLAASVHSVPEKWRDPWNRWCHSLAASALRGSIKAPFQREEAEAGAELLRVLAALLSWRGESLIRFVSCVVCRDSKRLEDMRLRLQAALCQLSGGSITFLDQLGILQNRRGILLHGPLLLEFKDGSLDLGLLTAPVRISDADIANVRKLHTSAVRCLTVENETTMQELAKQQSGTLLIQTSFASSAVIALFALLPDNLECRHFGDTDPAGFAILRDLRARTGRAVAPLHMNFRPSPDSSPLTDEDRTILSRLMDDPLLPDVVPELQAMNSSGSKGIYEQESLGIPSREWPFYPPA